MCKPPINGYHISAEISDLVDYAVKKINAASGNNKRKWSPQRLGQEAVKRADAPYLKKHGLVARAKSSKKIEFRLRLDQGNKNRGHGLLTSCASKLNCRAGEVLEHLLARYLFLNAFQCGLTSEMKSRTGFAAPHPTSPLQVMEGNFVEHNDIIWLEVDLPEAVGVSHYWIDHTHIETSVTEKNRILDDHHEHDGSTWSCAAELFQCGQHRLHVIAINGPKACRNQTKVGICEFNYPPAPPMGGPHRKTPSTSPSNSPV